MAIPFLSIVDEMRFNGANALEVERSRVRIHFRIRCSVLSVKRRKGLSCASTCRNAQEQASTIGTSDLGMVGFIVVCTTNEPTTVGLCVQGILVINKISDL